MTKKGLFGLGHVPPGAVSVMALLALVAAIGFFGPDRVSRVPAPADASAPPSASPTATFRAATLTTPSPTPVPTPAPGSLFVGNVEWVDWSPGGVEFAVTCLEPHVFTYVLDRQGNRLDRIRADDFRWLTADSYISVVIPPGDDWRERRMFFGRVGDVRQDWLPSGSGIRVTGPGERVAITTLDPGVTSESFQIWSPRGLLPARPGLPVAFSPEGSRLAVVLEPVGYSMRSAVQTATDKATIQIQDTDTGRVLATAAGFSLPLTSGAAFSPDGRYLAFQKTPGAEAPGRLGLLDASGGKLWTIPAPTAGGFDWSDATHLSVRTEQGTSAKPAELPVHVQFVAPAWILGPDTTNAVDTSSRGWVASARRGGDSLTVDKNGSTVELSFKGGVENLRWSPDGSELLVVWGVHLLPAQGGGGYAEVGQFVSLVRP